MKPRFTEEQYRFAREEANALVYAIQQGYPLARDGRNYRMRDHDSMVFTPDGRWFWNSRSLKGRAIEFLMHYENKTLPEAVLTLCESSGRAFPDNFSPSPAEPKKAIEKKPFDLPEKAKDCKRLFAYLCKTRCLDHEIIAQLVQNGDLYESVYFYVPKYGGNPKETHNAVFAGRDKDGVIRSAFQRGLSSYTGTAFKRDVEGSDPSAPFCLPGYANVNTVIVFEAAIDAISHASIEKANGRDYKNYDRIALGGTQKSMGLLAYLDCHPNIKHIVLAMDEDDAGREAAAHLERLILHTKHTVSQIHVPAGKDWNEYLCKLSERPAAP